MPEPNATGTQGNKRPAPASSRAQPLSRAAKAGQRSKPIAGQPPASAPRGGQTSAITPAIPRRHPGGPTGSAIAHTTRYFTGRKAIETAGNTTSGTKRESNSVA
ncbi:hypothetical protein S58_34710 [Bradyrhizobium oligotrophicum S58]|uniref:Uncharacterized protein n=1 Tax=Bradyrhizobium oligotrophicum S58 TaxID=1245469 RepID=M4Z7F7_9BRAD|nr:hypothetical protein S58_34710 [Bradyrhizobium oligotrophicum S58]